MALWLNSYTDFLVLAILIGTAQGGVQSLSRSLFGQLIPVIEPMNSLDSIIFLVNSHLF